ncbi:MAG: aldo/keto reductase, partial [Dermatophilaceae bacterium]
MSRLALGTMGWATGTTVDDARDQLKTFVAAGGDLVDTAYGYADGASEELLGTMLGDLVPRDELVICTKAGISRRSGTRVVDTSRRTLMHQLDTSLARLGTPYVDLWLVHTWSEDTPLAETLSALEWAVTSGRARYVGVSNYSGWQAAHAATLMSANRIPLVANEVEYSLLNRIPEDELVPASLALGFGLLPWSPLGRGVLTGKYRHGIPADSRAASREFSGLAGLSLTDESGQIVDAVTIAAQGLDVSPAEIALAWVR